MIRLYNQNIWGGMPKTDEIANRNQLVRSLIQDYQPDICTFQECSPNSTRKVEDALPLILSDIYAEACAQEAERNYNAIFYKKDKYLEIDSGYHAYAGCEERPGGKSKAVTWAVLERIADGKRFGIMSTHFWFKHLSEEDVILRLQNAEELEQVCKWMVEKYDVPVIVAGDFNNGKQSIQGDGPYQAMIQKGFEDVRYSAAQTTDCFTVHHYPTRNEKGEYAYGDMPHGTIDYIFMYGEKGLTAQKFQVDTSAKALSSSDHCPMIAEFILD